MTRPRSEPDLRLALVLNGGVSLAVWIGGVMHEIDRLRRAVGGPAETARYGEALADTGVESVRVDVIAGASAGGINGALLGAAIQGDEPLRAGGRPLRDVWLELGDLERLTRSTREIDPPSLLKGDDYIIPELEGVLKGLLKNADDDALKYPLYVYLTATDLRGQREARFATSAGEIAEPDHRVVFRFSAGEGAEKPAGSTGGDVLADKLPLDLSQAHNLARAARSSSSFPVAFPPHEAILRWQGGPDTENPPTFLADGGILDNQPFDPVLDRISTMEVAERWRRVLLYVVPYVTESKALDESRKPTTAPGLVEVARASGLARDLAKLTSLERVERARAEGVGAAGLQIALLDEAAAAEEAAPSLLPIYRRVQLDELRATATQWAASPRSVGTGALGQDECALTTQVVPPVRHPAMPAGDAPFGPLLPPTVWETAKQSWMAEDRSWCWGLSKAERFARTMLLWLRHADGDVMTASRHASRVIGLVRQAMRARKAAFYGRIDRGMSANDAFAASHNDIARDLVAIRTQLGTAVRAAANALGVQAPQLFAQLAALEVVKNAAGVRPAAPPAFDFYRVSASEPGAPVLEHPSRTPEAKLAGMQLHHFAAFLKRSWRANDWMWGRLDAATWIGLMLYGDDDAARDPFVRDLQIGILRDELPQLALAVDRDVRKQFSATADLALWRHENRSVLDRLLADPDEPADNEVTATFQACVLSPDRLTEEAGSRAGVATASRLAAVASRAFSGAGSDLPGPVRGLVGTTRRTTGLMNSLAVTFARAPALGMAVVFALAALAVALWVSDSAASWVAPALIALALLSAWSTFGWVSSPPNWIRALLLGGLLALLVSVAFRTLAPDGRRFSDPTTWLDFGDQALWTSILWVIALLAGAAGVALALVYLASSLASGAAARHVRSWIGWVLVLLLASVLLKLGWDGVTATDASGTAAWERALADHNVVRGALIVFVAACVLIPLAELLAVVFHKLWR